MEKDSMKRLVLIVVALATLMAQTTHRTIGKEQEATKGKHTSIKIGNGGDRGEPPADWNWQLNVAPAASRTRLGTATLDPVFFTMDQGDGTKEFHAGANNTGESHTVII